MDSIPSLSASSGKTQALFLDEAGHNSRLIRALRKCCTLALVHVANHPSFPQARGAIRSSRVLGPVDAQYSSGRSRVVADLSASVMIHNLSPVTVV